DGYTQKCSVAILWCLQFTFDRGEPAKEDEMVASRLRDVAELAGVSIRTVSNVVNGYAPVSADTRRRVQEALDQIGYRPNVLARNLKRGRTGMIALVLP